MNRILFALLVTCALTAAMDPQEEPTQNVNGTETNKTQIICAPVTTCGWVFYKPETGQPTLNVTNTYCVCEPGQACFIKYINDRETHAYTYTCTNETDVDLYDRIDS